MLGVKPEDLDRALIIGQIAGLLAKDAALKGKIAHKGAAMLRLVNLSQRLSRDLDTADIRGQRLEERAVRHALDTPAARKVVVRVDKVTAQGSETAWSSPGRSQRGPKSTRRSLVSRA